MTIKQIRQKARTMGLKNINRHRKESLIRVIQEAEGNSPCFKGIHGCLEHACLWRDECQC
ncbi:MAG TPA: Rho termination factor N-terminal domain-containing protein [Desulfomonilaceae bacterium]|nr:Rho termination factor N-terminal domain-containing protein [Desulfomonilaceae bacterium]